MKRRAILWVSGLALGLVLKGTTAFAQTTVSLTFDDGLLSATTAQQILDAHGMKGTFYVISGVIGTTPSFYLDLASIQAIQAAGHEIGGHTVTHADLAPPPPAAPLSAAQQQHEICDGRAQLIGMGFSPVSFAYPYGNATATTEAIVKACGYTSGRGAWCDSPGAGDSCTEPIPPADPYWIQTPEAVQNTTTLAQLQDYVTAAGGSGWVVLQFHFICADDDPTCGNGGGTAEQYGIGVSTFTAFISWLQGQGVAVKTVAEVMGGVTTPIPAISSLSPSTVTVGGSTFTLTVNGFNFISGSTVLLNGSARTTTFGSATQLSAQIPASDIAAVKVTTISVTNPNGAISPGTSLTLVNPLPVLTTLSSTFTVVGSTGITLTATGSNFVSTSTVRWNGAARATTFISSTTLNAIIPASDLATVKIASVTVFNAAPGGGTSAVRTFTVVNPVPVLTALSSTFTVVGSSTFTLTLTGSNFVSSSTVRWNGTARTTTFVNNTTLNAIIPASDLTTVNISSITVFNAAPGGGTSAIQLFSVGSPIPVLTTLSSTFTLVGSPDLTLILTGSNFIAGSIVQWNGSARTTTFINSTTLNATIPASDLAAVTIASIDVFSPGLGGGTSSAKTFTVGNPIPVLSALSSSAAVVGSPAFSLTITGSNFVASSVVQWNGSPRTTTFVNNTTLNALIPAGDLALVSIVGVTVFNPAPGGGTSNTQSFIVGNPGPGLAALSPNSTVVGSPTLTMTVTGLNFVLGSVVQWNGAPRTTSFTNSTTLTALIPVSDLSSVGIATVTISNPAPGGGTSNAQTFAVGNPVPALATLSSSATVAGSPAFVLTLTGSNFVSNSIVRWNGSARTTSFINSTTLTANIPASDLTTVSIATITISNPAPGGGTSNTQPFIVGSPAPALNTISPRFVAKGGPSFLLTATGANFVNTSFLQWNGTPVATIFLSSTILQATIPASDLLSEGSVGVSAFTPAPGGGTSAIRTLEIVSGAGGGAAASDPTLTTVNPTSVLAGAPAFTLTITGTNFASDATVFWNNAARATTFINSTQLTASIPASDVTAPGTASIFVLNPGAGTSTSQNILIGSNLVRVRPNPWRANLHSGQVITFDSLPANSTVKIFTTSAHSVKSLSAPSGSVTWDLKTDSGDNVASGYYIYLITGPGVKTRGIVAIIR